MAIRFSLYVKPGCHLCNEALELIAGSPLAGQVQVRDINTDPALMERYGLRIPVLADTAAAAELDWPFGPADLERFPSP